jgi:hypothetical protein
MPGDGVGLLPPRLPGMFQVAKPGFLLGIDPDERLARRHKVLFRGLTIAKLRVALGRLRP